MTVMARAWHRLWYGCIRHSYADGNIVICVPRARWRIAVGYVRRMIGERS